MSVSSYLRRVFDERNELIDSARRTLHDVDFDTVIGTGLSGALIVPDIARALNKQWAIVRKDNDSEHAMFNIEGYIGNQWLFFDDLVASGRTLRFVKEKVEAYSDAVYVGRYEYVWGTLNLDEGEI